MATTAAPPPAASSTAAPTGSVAATPATPSAAPPPPAHKNSFLTKLGQLGQLGHDALTKVLPAITHAAVAAEPIVDLLFPAQGPLYNTVVNAICLAEVKGAQAAASAPTGAQKFEAVWNAVGPQLLAVGTTNGLMSADADAAAKRYIQAIFNVLDGPAKIEGGMLNSPIAGAVKLDAAKPAATL